MNRIFLIGVLPFLLASISCDCEDDSVRDNVDITKITGKWYYQRLIIDGVTTHYTQQWCERHFIEFHDEENYKIYNRTNCESQVTEAGSYIATPENLHLTDETGGITSYTIVLLNSNTIVLDGNHDYDGDGTIDRVRLNFIRRI